MWSSTLPDQSPQLVFLSPSRRQALRQLLDSIELPISGNTCEPSAPRPKADRNEYMRDYMRRRRGRPERVGLAPWDEAGMSRSSWFRQRRLAKDKA